MLTEFAIFLSVWVLDHKMVTFTVILCLCLSQRVLTRGSCDTAEAHHTTVLRTLQQTRRIYGRAVKASALMVGAAWLWFVGLIYIWVLPAVAILAVLMVVDGTLVKPKPAVAKGRGV